MTNKKFKICIVDDKLPFVRDIDDSHLINSKGIQKAMVENSGWEKEQDLLNLTTLLINSDLFSKGEIEVYWATNPNILITAIRDIKYVPDLVIYDWEYGLSLAPEDSLTELLNTIEDSFFFVYSSYAQKIPIHLFKKHLDQYAGRFQVLRKGDNSYITSAEEIIFEYIALRVENNPKIKVGGLDVQFNKSGFLSDYKDILYLDNLLGREAILKGLLNQNKELSDETVFKMLDELNLKIYSNESKSIITLDDVKSNQELFGALRLVNNSDAYKKLGLKKLRELIEKGTVETR